MIEVSNHCPCSRTRTGLLCSGKAPACKQLPTIWSHAQRKHHSYLSFVVNTTVSLLTIPCELPTLPRRYPTRSHQWCPTCTMGYGIVGAALVNYTAKDCITLPSISAMGISFSIFNDTFKGTLPQAKHIYQRQPQSEGPFQQPQVLSTGTMVCTIQQPRPLARLPENSVGLLLMNPSFTELASYWAEACRDVTF